MGLRSHVSPLPGCCRAAGASNRMTWWYHGLCRGLSGAAPLWRPGPYILLLLLLTVASSATYRPVKEPKGAEEEVTPPLLSSRLGTRLLVPLLLL